MSTTDQIVRQVERLPESLRKEVLDFVEFLKDRHHIAANDGNKHANSTLLELSGGLEDSVNFSGDDVSIQERLRDEWN